MDCMTLYGTGAEVRGGGADHEVAASGGSKSLSINQSQIPM